MKPALLILAALPLWSQAISVSPSSVPAGGNVTLTISGAPAFRDNWYSPYPGSGPTVGGYLPCCWGWLNGTQSSAPPASPIAATTLTVKAPPNAGTYVYVLHGGNGGLGPYNPIAQSGTLIVTSGSPPPPLTFTAGTGATAAICSLNPPASGFIQVSCTGCNGATKIEKYPAPIPAPGTMAEWLLCGNTVSITFAPSKSQMGKTDYAVGINGNPPAQTGTF